MCGNVASPWVLSNIDSENIRMKLTNRVRTVVLPWKFAIATSACGHKGDTRNDILVCKIHM